MPGLLTHIILPLILTFVIAGPMWPSYLSNPTQERFDAAAHVTWSAFLASGMTSAMLAILSWKPPYLPYWPGIVPLVLILIALVAARLLRRY